MYIYFNCNCEPTLSNIELYLQGTQNETRISTSLLSDNNIYCNLLSSVATQGVF